MGLPISCHDHNASSAKYSALSCFNDGSYTMRFGGFCDPRRDEFTWSFCGVVDGGAQEQFSFNISNGVCYPGPRRSSSSLCGEYVNSIAPSPAPATSVPTTFPTVNQTATPSIATTSPTIAALGMQTPLLPNKTLSNNSFECSTSCGAMPYPLSTQAAGNTTCLLVTLMDQFGDGWSEGVGLRYWVEEGVDSSNIVVVAPGCGCSVLSSCLQPLHEEVEQDFHLVLDENGSWPAYYWDVYWTVQAVEGGELKEKYYGGFNTSMTFKYSPSGPTWSFAATSLTNVWLPPTNKTCSTSDIESRVHTGVGLPYSYGNETGLYEEDGSGGYFETIYVITDAKVSSRTDR